MITVHKVHTKDNVADVLTKGLGRVLHWSFLSKLGLCSSLSPIRGGDTPGLMILKKSTIRQKKKSTNMVSVKRVLPHKLMIRI